MLLIDSYMLFLTPLGQRVISTLDSFGDWNFDRDNYNNLLFENILCFRVLCLLLKLQGFYLRLELWLCFCRAQAGCRLFGPCIPKLPFKQQYSPQIRLFIRQIALYEMSKNGACFKIYYFSGKQFFKCKTIQLKKGLFDLVIHNFIQWLFVCL